MKEVILATVFFISAGLVVYIYLGYPLVLSLLARIFRQPHIVEEKNWPSVSLVISAYNEAEVIREKLLNALALDYPKELLEIVVVSDASDDGTDEIVLGFSDRGVKLVRQNERLGKSSGLNLAIPACRGQIVVFSDANAIYRPDAIRLLVRHLADSRVGYVVGNARYIESANQASSAESEGLYWKLETWLKQKESEFGSVVGGDGAIYAIRRELFTPLLPTDINDFLNPLQIIAKGYRGVYDFDAVCFEEAGDSFSKEFRRKTRIIGRSLNATVRRAPHVLLPWVQPRHWFALVSHKLLRWFAPVFLILALISAALLAHDAFFRWILWLQLAFYLCALIGWKLDSWGKTAKVFYIPYYFCLVNIASLIGMFKFFTGTLSPTWQTIRQAPPEAPNSKPRLAGKSS